MKIKPVFAMESVVSYPCIARNLKHRDLVVLFTKQTTGICLSGDSGEVGIPNPNYISVTNNNEWEILPSGSKLVLEIS